MNRTKEPADIKPRTIAIIGKVAPEENLADAVAAKIRSCMLDRTQWPADVKPRTIATRSIDKVAPEENLADAVAAKIRSCMLGNGVPPKTKAVEMDNTALLVCDAMGDPEPNVTWHKDYLSTPKFSVPSSGTKMTNGKMMIDPPAVSSLSGMLNRLKDNVKNNNSTTLRTRYISLNTCDSRRDGRGSSWSPKDRADEGRDSPQRPMSEVVKALSSAESPEDKAEEARGLLQSHENQVKKNRGSSHRHNEVGKARSSAQSPTGTAVESCSSSRRPVNIVKESRSSQQRSNEDGQDNLSSVRETLAKVALRAAEVLSTKMPSEDYFASSIVPTLSDTVHFMEKLCFDNRSHGLSPDHNNLKSRMFRTRERLQAKMRESELLRAGIDSVDSCGDSDNMMLKSVWRSAMREIEECENTLEDLQNHEKSLLKLTEKDFNLTKKHLLDRLRETLRLISQMNLPELEHRLFCTADAVDDMNKRLEAKERTLVSMSEMISVNQEVLDDQEEESIKAREDYDRWTYLNKEAKKDYEKVTRETEAAYSKMIMYEKQSRILADKMVQQENVTKTIENRFEVLRHLDRMCEAEERKLCLLRLDVDNVNKQLKMENEKLLRLPNEYFSRVEQMNEVNNKMHLSTIKLSDINKKIDDSTEKLASLSAEIKFSEKQVKLSDMPGIQRNLNRMFSEYRKKIQEERTSFEDERKHLEDVLIQLRAQIKHEQKLTTNSNEQCLEECNSAEKTAPLVHMDYAQCSMATNTEVISDGFSENRRNKKLIVFSKGTEEAACFSTQKQEITSAGIEETREDIRQDEISPVNESVQQEKFCQNPNEADESHSEDTQSDWEAIKAVKCSSGEPVIDEICMNPSRNEGPPSGDLHSDCEFINATDCSSCKPAIEKICSNPSGSEESHSEESLSDYEVISDAYDSFEVLDHDLSTSTGINESAENVLDPTSKNLEAVNTASEDDNNNDDDDSDDNSFIILDDVTSTVEL